MSMPYRYQEILTVLQATAPNGLKPAEIYAACKAKVGSEITNNQNVHHLLHSMRTMSPAHIKRIDAPGGSIYSITPSGSQALAQALGAEFDGGVVAEAIDIDRDTHQNAGPNELERISEQVAISKFDIQDTLDRALDGLVKLIRDAAAVPVITAKPEKLALIESLENNELLRGEARSLLAQIRTDLEQLDDAE